MDHLWNASAERHAEDRIHQIGQYKPVRYVLVFFQQPIPMKIVNCYFLISRIVRFVIENTIEERILKLQEKKELVFEG